MEETQIPPEKYEFRSGENCGPYMYHIPSYIACWRKWNLQD